MLAGRRRGAGDLAVRVVGRADHHHVDIVPFQHVAIIGEMVRHRVVAREPFGLAGRRRCYAYQTRVRVALQRAGVNDANELRADKADADGIVHFELPSFYGIILRIAEEYRHAQD